jgi:hypothetical protein
MRMQMFACEFYAARYIKRQGGTHCYRSKLSCIDQGGLLNRSKGVLANRQTDQKKPAIVSMGSASI